MTILFFSSNTLPQINNIKINAIPLLIMLNPDLYVKKYKLNIYSRIKVSINLLKLIALRI